MKCVYNDAGRCNLFTNEWCNGTCTNNEDCPYRKPLTNYDRIVSKSPEDLARGIAWLIVEAVKQLHPFATWKATDEMLISETAEVMLEWLKQEAQE